MSKDATEQKVLEVLYKIITISDFTVQARGLLVEVKSTGMLYKLLSPRTEMSSHTQT